MYLTSSWIQYSNLPRASRLTVREASGCLVSRTELQSAIGEAQEHGPQRNMRVGRHYCHWNVKHC